VEDAVLEGEAIGFCLHVAADGRAASDLDCVHIDGLDHHDLADGYLDGSAQADRRRH